jgi:hypothetical protein
LTTDGRQRLEKEGEEMGDQVTEYQGEVGEENIGK